MWNYPYNGGSMCEERRLASAGNAGSDVKAIEKPNQNKSDT